MVRRVMVLGLVIALAAVVGVGLAGSLGHEEPGHAWNPDADEVFVAGPDGEALRCKGRLVRVKRSALGGEVPTLTPAQAARRGPAPVRVFRCAVGPDGKETGAVAVVDAGAARP
jgi:hypothetical protein